MKTFTILLLISSVFLLNNCTSNPSDSMQTANAQTSETVKTDTPPDFSTLQSNLEEYINSKKLAGISALVMQRGETVYRENVGFQDLESETPVTDQTIFRLASLTKPIVSTAMMLLVERGELDLETPVSKYIPEFADLKVHDTGEKAENVMMVKHLLNHTSGISSGLESDEVGEKYREWYGEGGKESLKEIVGDLAKLPLVAEPSTKFTYSHSIDVLAYIIEVVSGQSVDVFLEENLFKPLEMKDTGYKIETEKLKHLATIYGYDENDQLYARETNKESIYAKGHLPRGNFGLVSTVSDYSHFAEMLLNKGSYKNKQILKPETVESMTSNQLSSDLLPLEIGGIKFDNLGFGYGFAVSQGGSNLGKIEGSFGWIGASHTYCFIDPKNEVIGILFTQLSGTRKCPILFQFNEWMYSSLNEH